MSTKLKMPIKAASDMLNTQEAAALLGVSRRFLDKDRYEARANGTSPKIPYVDLGHRTVRYHRDDVVAFLDANRVS